MTSSTSDPTGNSELRAELLDHQIETCDELINAVLSHYSPGEDELIFSNLNDCFESLEEATHELFDDPDKTQQIVREFRRILIEFAVDREFDGRINENYGDDNIVRIYRFFKLYTTVVLGYPMQGRNEFALVGYEESLDNFNRVRGSREHGRRDPTEDKNLAPIGYLILIWYLLEDVLKRWRDILEKPEESIEVAESVLNSGDPEMGFINYIQEDRHQAHITSYRAGVGEDTPIFRVYETDSFIKEGDIVEFGLKEDDDGSTLTDGHGHPFAKEVELPYCDT
jgi:hypothetical protein